MRFTSSVLFILALSSSSAQFFLNGPDAPLVSVSYSANAFTLTLDNPATSNNFNELYQEGDPGVPNPNDSAQHWYFQGYKVFQVLNGSIGILDLNNASVARQVAQTDIQDSISVLINYKYDTLINNCVAVQMVNGSNTGTQLVYTLQTDVFTNQPYHPDSTYCFLAVAYASNLYHSADSICSAFPEEYKESFKSPLGSIQTHCVTGTTLSVGQNVQNEEPVFFPNPSVGVINVAYSGRGVVRVHNALGRVLLSQEINGRTELNVTRHPTGVYTVEFITQDGRRFTQQHLLE